MTVVGTVVSELTREMIGEHEVTVFRMRSEERRFDKQAGRWVPGRFLVTRVTCWRRLGDAVYASLRQDDPVIVLGRLHLGTAGECGNSRGVPELEALAVGPDLGRATAVLRRRGRPSPPQASAGQATVSEPDTAAQRAVAA
ncbi:single-stranded DNA-binding protein [Amycolatopsis suaedae]|uniref:Single-stranded DNA-binding protein n=1 Tax=Amycolatopsis suaedae TaxID=2510978 RepID=A0A4Q7IZU4_9PSEU|nr:single-stranded DNA-binding protein [Amycolatopsis suaedae]RZQ59626.1 single-stranded DNA-binding protein [Amycolatopsis suaedae]